jgi:hypothetical protein
MSASSLQQLWLKICELSPKCLNDPRLPLEHLDEALRYFELEPLQSGRKRFVKGSPIFIKDANFKDLQHEDLIDLRYCLYTGEALDTANVWAEKLLRFCEVRLNSLRQRATEKCGNLNDGRLLVLHLAAFLLDYAGFSRDLRYLNTVLKLLDQKWLFDERSIQSHLSGQTSTAIFEFRLLLVTESMLARLESGGTL